MARPSGSIGEISREIVSLAATRPVTYADVALSLRLSRRHASDALSRLAAAGHIDSIARTSIDGARRPVNVYRAQSLTWSSTRREVWP